MSSPIRGYEKHELCHHLAKEDIPVSRLAQLYGITPDAVYKFGERNAKKIDAIRAEFVRGIDNKLTGMWIADQANRIAEYESDVDLIREHVGESLDQEGSDKLLRIKHAALKSVAEELGALPTRQTVDHSGNVEVKYTVERPSDAT